MKEATTSHAFTSEVIVPLEVSHGPEAHEQVELPGEKYHRLVSQLEENPSLRAWVFAAPEQFNVNDPDHLELLINAWTQEMEGHAALERARQDELRRVEAEQRLAELRQADEEARLAAEAERKASHDRMLEAVQQHKMFAARGLCMQLLSDPYFATSVYESMGQSTVDDLLASNPIAFEQRLITERLPAYYAEHPFIRTNSSANAEAIPKQETHLRVVTDAHEEGRGTAANERVDNGATTVVVQWNGYKAQATRPEDEGAKGAV